MARWWNRGWLEVGRHEIKHPPAGTIHSNFASGRFSCFLVRQPFLYCRSSGSWTGLAAGFDLHHGRFCHRHVRGRGGIQPDSFAPGARVAPVYSSLGNHDGGYWAGRHRGYPDTAWVRDFVANAAAFTYCITERWISPDQRPRPAIGGPGRCLRGGMYSRFSLQPARPLPLPHIPWCCPIIPIPRIASRAVPVGFDVERPHTHGGQFYLPGIGAPVRPRWWTNGLSPGFTRGRTAGCISLKAWAICGAFVLIAVQRSA